jgi:hypothetical protein
MKVGFADTMTGAIPSTVPLGVLIVTFCQPRNDMDSPDLFGFILIQFKWDLGKGIDYYPMSWSLKGLTGLLDCSMKEFKVRLEPRYCK